MRAFITGVTGFAGAHLAQWLIAAGTQVLGSVRDRAVPPSEIDSGLSRTARVEWNLDEPSTESLAASLREFRPEVVYHLAALSIPSDCGEGTPTERAWRVNVEATGTLLQVLERLPSPPRLVFVSTSHVYGPATWDDFVARETRPVDPRSAYAKTKLAGEQLVREAAARGRIEALVIRAFKHVGPRQNDRMMLMEWVAQYVRGANPVRVQCLDSHVDVTDVRDVVRAYHALAEKGATGEIYNVGSGVSRRTGDILERLRVLTDPDRPIVETQPGRRQEMIADINKLVAVTGWRPRIELDQTLRDTLDDFRRR